MTLQRGILKDSLEFICYILILCMSVFMCIVIYETVLIWCIFQPYRLMTFFPSSFHYFFCRRRAMSSFSWGSLVYFTTKTNELWWKQGRMHTFVDDLRNQDTAYLKVDIGLQYDIQLIVKKIKYVSLECKKTKPMWY